MSKLPEDIRAMYTDAYKLHETLYGIGDTDEEWMNAAILCGQVGDHHNAHPLIVDLIVAVMDELARERKRSDGS